MFLTSLCNTLSLTLLYPIISAIYVVNEPSIVILSFEPTTQLLYLKSPNIKPLLTDSSKKTT